MQNPRLTRYLCGLSLLAACGSTPSGGPVLDIGHSINTSAMHTLLLQNEGSGTLMALPAGSTCLAGARRLSLSMASQILNWVRCVGSTSTAYHEVTGKYLLTTNEYYAFVPLLDQITIKK